MIEITSNRLAPFRFFTGRTDIPRYSLSLQDDNMRGLVISGTNIQMPRQDLIIDAAESSSSEEDQAQPILPIQPILNHNIDLANNPVNEGRSRVDEILNSWNIMFRMSL